MNIIKPSRVVFADDLIEKEFLSLSDNNDLKSLNRHLFYARRYLSGYLCLEIRGPYFSSRRFW